MSKLEKKVLSVLRGRFNKHEFVHINCIAGFLPNKPSTVQIAAWRLVKQRVVESRKGPGGGYRLIRD